MLYIHPIKCVAIAAILFYNGIETASAQSVTVPVLLRNQHGETEEYSVLKADKNIRQGLYTKYKVVPGPRNEIAMRETGSYELGQKEGEWRTFYDGHVFNRLSSKGTYHAGLPEGQWAYYHRPASGAPSKIIFTGKNSEEGLVIDLEDTIAVVRAKGRCARGAKVGLWKYYDKRGQLVQAVNESTNTLMYWQPPAGPPLSGEILAANHPLLCVGGNELLLDELMESVYVPSLLEAGENILKIGQTDTAEMVISVDSVGRQNAITLAMQKEPNKYEQYILARMSKVVTHWLPQIVNGRAVAANQRFLVVAIRMGENKVALSVKILSD